MYLKKRMNAVITACILMTGAFVASCSNDDAAPDGGVVAQGDPVAVTVTINQTSPTNSRASTSMEGALPNEIKITDDNLVIFVFDASSGNLESTHAVKIATNNTTASNTATSESFSVTAGSKYFYIFANANTALNDFKGSYINGETYLRSLAPANSNHTDFKGQVLNKLEIVALLSQSGKFLIGSLWADDSANLKTIDPPVSSTAPPVEISGLKVGRLVSKVSFLDAYFDTQFNAATLAGAKLIGNWSGVEWRIVNQPDEMFVVGNWENYLPGNSGSQVKTPFFDNSIDLFWNVTSLTDATQVIKPNSQTSWRNDTEVLYTLENTHKEPKKGNTTAVQFRGKFSPTANVYNSDGTPGTLTGGTFYASYVTNTLTDVTTLNFYNANPTQLANHTYSPVIKYNAGEVYYLAYITDSNEPKEDEGNKRYAVLRNHQYKLDIKSISRLGDNDENPFNKPDGEPENIIPGGPDDPKPTDPIDKDIPNITISIQVMDWYRINQSIEWK